MTMFLLLILLRLLLLLVSNFAFYFMDIIRTLFSKHIMYFIRITLLNTTLTRPRLVYLFL
jgi:hypothetical protein